MTANHKAQGLAQDRVEAEEPISLVTMPAETAHPGTGDANSTLTVLADQPTEPDKTDETDLSRISNADFLAAVFGTLEGDSRPVICSFAGNPNEVAPAKWFGRPWESGEEGTGTFEQNSYFSLAKFTPDGGGKYRRQKKHFAALSALMFDDIGTKASGRERLDSLPPSWLIETSPGNYQAGYIFAEPLTDAAMADAICNAAIAAGLCDSGADGPCSRIARLPVGINGKHEPAFSCRLVEWNPERRYSPDQIVNGLELELIKPKEKVRPTRSHSAAVEPDEDAVYTPRSAENSVIAALKERVLYKSPLGSGKHDITCPWVHEHTDAVDNGTAYFEPGGGYPIGGFKCQHGHCAGKRISALIGHLGITSQAAKHKPTIRVAPGELDRIVDAAEKELSLTGRHYQRGGLVVSVVTDPGTHETTVKAVSKPSLVRAMSAIANWERFDARSQEFVAIDPPERHAGILDNCEVYKHMPVLNGIARQPYLRPDGSLMTNAGYDEVTGMFGVFNEATFSIPASPSRAEAAAALAELSELLEEFEFAADHDQAAALAAMLTAVIRPSLAQAPMFHIKAPQVASGKSYLSSLITAFATPMRPSALSFPNDDEECRKLLLSALLTASPVLCFDNLTSDLFPHKSLCSALTEEFITGRILGISKTATVGTRALFLSSGNNVDPVKDMARRCVTIRLDPACETPATRDFKGNPLATVRGDRARYVSLALTIIRAWITAERPTTVCKSLGSFEGWTEWVRQPLLWLDLADPATSVFDGMATDPDRETLGRLLQAIYKIRGNRPTMIREIIQAAQEFGKGSVHTDLREVIMEIADERGVINRGRLGWWITRHAGKIVDGLKFEKASGARNAAQWKVVSIPSVSSVSSGIYRPTAKSVSSDGGEETAPTAIILPTIAAKASLTLAPTATIMATGGQAAVIH